MPCELDGGGYRSRGERAVEVVEQGIVRSTVVERRISSVDRLFVPGRGVDVRRVGEPGPKAAIGRWNQGSGFIAHGHAIRRHMADAHLERDEEQERDDDQAEAPQDAPDAYGSGG